MKIPNLSSSVDTVIDMYYGNAAAANQEDVANVWDVNFDGVWHQNNDLLDSTSTANDGTSVGSTNITGQMADGENVDGTNQYIDYANTGSALNVGQDFTLSAWVKRNDLPGTGDSILTKLNGSYYSWKLSFEPTDEIRLDILDGALGNDSVIGAQVTDTSAWHHIVARSDGTTLNVFLDGVKHGNSTTVSRTIAYDGSDALVGVSQWGGSLVDYINASIDEVRISDNARSDDWIATEYNNQANPASFFSVGSQQALNVITVDTTSDVSDGTTTSIFDLLNNKGADGFVSLREAILAANNTANGVSADHIMFDIAGAGVQTISLLSALPSITDAVNIDAYSQTGASANTLSIGDDAVLLIELDGSGAD